MSTARIRDVVSAPWQGIAETADLADATALGTFEETTADDYANLLTSWAAGQNSPWATEQAQMATADAAWVHAVAPAQYNNVKGIDDAQIGWITTASGAAVGQVTDDSNAWAAAVGQTAQAAADHVKADGAAWVAEVNQVAQATTTYDEAAVDDARQAVKSQAEQTWGYRQTLDQEQILYETTVENKQMKTPRILTVRPGAMGKADEKQMKTPRILTVRPGAMRHHMVRTINAR